MTIPGRTHKDQRKHRRKVMWTPEGREEHRRREERRGTRGDWVRDEMKKNGQHKRTRPRHQKKKTRYNRGQS